VYYSLPNFTFIGLYTDLIGYISLYVVFVVLKFSILEVYARLLGGARVTRCI